ncbi:hypothetical protein [Roseomonas chloroacetimidivorans]|uniref:hypothetical protein n=1 Tax=Roseomonas chloroacetimidivorans TaxID=1766656 RepID=UPI003C729FBD
MEQVEPPAVTPAMRGALKTAKEEASEQAGPEETEAGLRVLERMEISRHLGARISVLPEAEGTAAASSALLH